MIDHIDLHAQLLSVRKKEEDVLKEVFDILSAEETTNTFDFDKLDTHRIFHLNHIREICIDYRLRFLDISRFKGVIPQEAISQQRAIEQKHGTQLKHLKIMAPSKLDSKYICDAVEKKWVFGWEKKNFKDKKNIDLWKIFLEVYRKQHVRIQWIKGHNQHPQNEWCDKAAVKASKDTTTHIEDTAYINAQ